MTHAIGIMQEKAGSFRLTFPDLPGVVAEGESPQAAVDRAGEQLAERLATAEETGVRLRSLEDLAAEEPDRMAGGIAVAVPVVPVSRPQPARPRGALPGEGLRDGGQVPLSGKLAATEEPTDAAKAKAAGGEAERLPAPPARDQRATDDL